MKFFIRNENEKPKKLNHLNSSKFSQLQLTKQTKLNCIYKMYCTYKHKYVSKCFICPKALNFFLQTINKQNFNLTV